MRAKCSILLRYRKSTSSRDKDGCGPEVRNWLEGLSTTQFATAALYVDLFAVHGPLLSEPRTRQLDGKLRFHLGGQTARVTYWLASQRMLRRCVAAAHTADDDGEE